MKVKVKVMSLVLIFCLFCASLSNVSVAKAEGEQFIEATAFKVENGDSFQSGLIANAEKAVSSTVSSIKSSKSTTSTYFKFTMPEDGIAILYYSMTEDVNNGDYVNSIWNIYADSKCTIAVAKDYTIYDSASNNKEFRVYLLKGTYYIKCSGENNINYGDITNRVGLAVGYIPLKGKTTDFTVTRSTTKTTTDKIILTIKTSDPDAKVYALKDAQSDFLLDNSARWTEETRLKDNTYVVTENGKYTIRIWDSLGKYYQEVITIDNIDKTRPTSPEVTTYKAGTATVVGKAEAGVLVTATIGKKTYSAITRDDGVFTIKTGKLAKGNKIVLQAKDAAGNKSDKKTVKVK